MSDQQTILGSWKDFFKKEYHLSDLQCDQLEIYAHELQQWNQKMNLTALESMDEIVQFHFQDSLAASDAIDFVSKKSFVDVGTGAGFPALPLKIAFPHVRVILIEVLQKRVTFLKHMIELLGLENVTIVDCDWRTFLRTTQEDVDLVLARASLAPEELIRMFKPSSHYRNATLVYWASQFWAVTPVVQPYVQECYEYSIAGKIRKLVMLSTSDNKIETKKE